MSKSIPEPNNLPENPKLSVCMIVRDEEKTLPRCLKSVEPVANELIVIDTGSKDNTVLVANDLGAKVFHFEWCDDFAAARNESIKHATSDWVLQIDADEELVGDSIPHLRQCIRKPNVICYSIKCDNGPTYTGPRFGWFDRLFRRHPHIFYHGPYHETVSQSARDLIAANSEWGYVSEPNVVLRHYGCEGSNISKTKHERGVAIMESYVKANPKDAYMLSQLGTAYSALGRSDEAVEYLKKALQIEPNCPTTNFTLGVTLQEVGSLKEAAAFYQKAISVDSNFAEAYASLGAIHLDQGMLDLAISASTKSLEINPDLALGLCNLGLAYVGKGLHAEGVATLKKAISINPGLAEAHMNLGVAYTKQGRLEDAIIEYEKALKIDPDYPRAHYNYAITLFKNGSYEKAVEQCDKAVELGVEVHPQFLEWLQPHRS